MVEAEGMAADGEPDKATVLVAELGCGFSQIGFGGGIDVETVESRFDSKVPLPPNKLLIRCLLSLLANLFLPIESNSPPDET